jgi:hypothetical protein
MQPSEVLDVLVQLRQDKAAARKLMRKPLREQGFAPTVVKTDNLRSYGAAFAEIGLAARNEQGLRKNNRAEVSHQPLQRRERKMQGLKSDVSIQGKVLVLPADTKAKLQLSSLFGTHGLRVPLRTCDRIAVMRHGGIVALAKTAETAEIFARPRHPYTKALFDAVPGAARSQSPAAAQEEIPWTSRRTASCLVGASPCRARRTGRSPG